MPPPTQHFSKQKASLKQAALNFMAAMFYGSYMAVMYQNLSCGKRETYFRLIFYSAFITLMLRLMYSQYPLKR